MPKYLATTKDFTGSPGEFYTHIQQHYFYRKEGTQSAALVTPYTIITDRNDVVMFNTSDMQLTTGFKCKIPKKAFCFRHSLQNFNKMVESAISEAFYNLFTDLNVDPKEVEILSTIRAIYSIDKREAIPIYFLLLPETKVVKFKPSGGTRVTVYPYDDLVQVGLTDKSADLMTKSIAYLIGVGELGIPITQKSEGI